MTYNTSVMKRIIFDVVLFLSIFILPWWVTAVLAFVGIFIFGQFYEFIISGAIMYTVYSSQDGRAISSYLWFPLILCFLYVGIQALRRYIILYKNEN
jgi:hypothetical protein